MCVIRVQGGGLKSADSGNIFSFHLISRASSVLMSKAVNEAGVLVEAPLPDCIG